MYNNLLIIKEQKCYYKITVNFLITIASKYGWFCGYFPLIIMINITLNKLDRY